MKVRILLLGCLASGAWGCLSSNGTTAPDDAGAFVFDAGAPFDAGSDAARAVDAGANDATTTPVDAATDDAALPADAGVDSGLDAGSDSGLDSGIDSGADAGIDSSVDAATTDAGCGPGFAADGGGCTPIDSCTTNNGGCNAHATCTDTGPGTNTCACNSGYSGNGTTCAPIDNCLTSNGGCDAHATCTDTGPGTNTCACNSGYSGSGTTCAAIDNCLTSNGGCDAHATCTDTGPGTNTCACNSGYFGSGTTCTSIGAPSFTCGTSHSLILLAGKLGGSGNLDGVGTAARFDNPWGVAYDGAGGILIVDYANNAIRRLEISTSAVTTLAGGAGGGELDGTGAGALLDNPQFITTDGAGNAYVTDVAGETVRKVVLSTGAVTTVAGQPYQAGTVNGAALTTATFDYPQGIAYASGNLFVADYEDDTLRQIDLSTQMVSTLAGATDGGVTFNFPQGVATDGAGYVYVTDQTGGIPLTKVDIATGTAATLGSAFGQPYQGLSYAGAQGLLVDMGSSAVFVSTSSGAVTTIPTGTGSLASTVSAAVDGSGNIWAADTFGVIQEVNASTGNVTDVAGELATSGLTPGTGAAAEFASPASVAWDGASTVYVADTCAVSAVNLSTLAVSVLAGSTTCGSNDATGASASFNQIDGITYDGHGNLFVADTGNDVIRQIVVASGAVTTIAGTAGSPGSAIGTGVTALFNAPGGLVSDGAGHLYVADTQNGIIRKVTVGATKAATQVSTFVPAGTYPRPFGLVLDAAGTNLYVADATNLVTYVGKVVVATQVASKLSLTYGGSALTLESAQGIAMDVEGNLYVADSGEGVIYQVSLSTNVAVIYAGAVGKHGAAPGALPATLSGPHGLAFVSGNQAVVPGVTEGTLLGLCP